MKRGTIDILFGIALCCIYFAITYLIVGGL